MNPSGLFALIVGDRYEKEIMRLLLETNRIIRNE